MALQGRAEGRETLEFLINATAKGTRQAVRTRLAAGMPAAAIRRELLNRMQAEFADENQRLLNASLIATVHLTLGEMLN